MDLLFDLAVWHAYAKLRLHMDDTLKYFDTATATLGHSVRKFSDKVCPAYVTTELPQEQAAWGCQQARLAAQAPNSEHGGGAVVISPNRNRRTSTCICTSITHLVTIQTPFDRS